MVEILTNIGYINVEKLKEWLATTIVFKPITFSTGVNAIADTNDGKVFTLSNFPESCIIKEIRVRSNFISGQQIWRVAFVNNANGITPTDTNILCDTAEIFEVGDYIHIEDEIAYVSVVDEVNNSITVIRGVKGTTATYHDYRARMETANDGIRLVLFKQSSRKLAGRIRIMKDLMSWSGITNVAITAGDKAIKLNDSPVNISKYDFIYLIDGNRSERASVEGINGIVKDNAYSDDIYVADPLLAHVSGIEVQKQMINDIPIILSEGDGNLYGSVYVDEKIDSTLYPTGINITIDIIVDTLYGKFR